MLASHFLSRISLLHERVAASPDAKGYPFNLPALRHLDELELHPKVTFFVGENGSGKSTLLEAIAVALGLNAEGGSQNFNFGTYASHSPLHQYLRIARGFMTPRSRYFLRAESFYNVASEIERLDEDPFGGPPVKDSYGGESLHAQSHGESFMALLEHRFGGQGLYLLDEPEAALSPRRQLAALSRIHDLVRYRSQFIIATHSPILMAYPDARIYHFSAAGIAPIRYEDTEHYAVTRAFLNDPAGQLKTLLNRT